MDRGSQGVMWKGMMVASSLALGTPHPAQLLGPKAELQAGVKSTAFGLRLLLNETHTHTIEFVFKILLLNRLVPLIFFF